MSRQRHEVIPVRPVTVPAPSGLSVWACQTWTELQTEHDFELHECIALERALKWWDRSDAALRAADAASGAEAAAFTKQAIDCASAALRHWRTLKFPAPAGIRPPGRPSGANWNAHRRAASA